MVSSDKDPKAKPSQRELKLAQALRANLRRRKAGAAAPGQTKSGEED
jgi:hypothetical protein